MADKKRLGWADETATFAFFTYFITRRAGFRPDALWQLAQNVLAPQNIDRLGTAWYRDMLNIYVRKVS